MKFITNKIVCLCQLLSQLSTFVIDLEENQLLKSCGISAKH